ncbi:MAG: ammonium transporter [Candidatus Hydrogenedentes bacterium]|nr:ammonium transporter [Candidatus Hydrogenedentota bacterium]
MNRSVWARGRGLRWVAAVFAALAGAGSAAAEEAAVSAVDSGDTAWMLTSMALVLFMTLPGLALFYGGLVRTKNVLSVLMQCLVITCVVTMMWAVAGYSLSFSTAGMVSGEITLNAFIGGLDRMFCLGLAPDSVYGTQTIPEPVFFCYQLTFAIITPGLIIGAFAERMKFSAMLLFTSLWTLFSYFPVAHMVWGGAGAFLADRGVLDFAGGIVVHLNAGVAALVCAVMLGKRQGYPEVQMAPHSLTLAVVGTSMLWVGWFGFNAGSAVAANGTAAMAMMATHLAAAAAACVWMGIEWVKYGKPSVLGICTGAVAGLATVTPASGFVGPLGALVIGAAAGGVCFVCATSVKRHFGYDDSLDAFGVHGVGGLLGTVLTGVFAAKALGGYTPNGLGIGSQLGAQFLGIAVTLVWSGAVSVVLLKALDATVGLRVKPQEEMDGLDITQHNEQGYNY